MGLQKQKKKTDVQQDWERLSKGEKKASYEHADKYTSELEEIDKALAELDEAMKNDLQVH
jgi:uncharacterized protein YabN with tetrapyrrole methylase and pyrophosphatase domain